MPKVQTPTFPPLWPAPAPPLINTPPAPLPQPPGAQPHAGPQRIVEPIINGKEWKMAAKWFVDVVVDLPWFIARRGKIGQPRARAQQNVYEPDLKTELLLYGDDEAIRHLRVMMDTEDEQTAHACQDRNIHQWINALGVSSALATPSFTTAAMLQKDSAAFMTFLIKGDEASDSFQLNPQYAPPAKADFAKAAQLMVSWRPDFKIHLHFLSHFLNHTLPPEARWLNGYRVIEWHFLRGQGGSLASDRDYRTFIGKHGAALDAHLKDGQTRHGLIEEVRALAAHAIVTSTADPRNERGATDLILRTFAALESLVIQVMNAGAEGCTFHPITPQLPPSTK
jgi:hypothetical protein